MDTLVLYQMPSANKPHTIGVSVQGCVTLNSSLPASVFASFVTCEPRRTAQSWKKSLVIHVEIW